MLVEANFKIVFVHGIIKYTTTHLLYIRTTIAYSIQKKKSISSLNKYTYVHTQRNREENIKKVQPLKKASFANLILPLEVRNKKNS